MKYYKNWSLLALRITNNWLVGVDRTVRGKMTLDKFIRMIRIGTKNLVIRFPH